MINAEVMNTLELREFHKLMKEIYGTIIQGTLYKGSNERIYLGTEETKVVDLEKINAEGVGLYIGRVEPDGFRPSIEGAQLMSNAKNIIEVTKEQALEWIKGQKIELKTNYQGYGIISYNKDILGACKVSKGNVWNYTPKERRIKNTKETNLKK